MAEERKVADKLGASAERVPPSKRGEKESESAQVTRLKTGLFSTTGWFTLLTIMILEGILVAGITVFFLKRSPSSEEVDKTPPVYLDIKDFTFQVPGDLPDTSQRVTMDITLVINKKKGNADEVRDLLNSRIPHIKSFILNAMDETEPEVFSNKNRQHRTLNIASIILAKLNSEYPEYLENVLIHNFDLR